MLRRTRFHAFAELVSPFGVKHGVNERTYLHALAHLKNAQRSRGLATALASRGDGNAKGCHCAHSKILRTSCRPSH